MTNLSLPSKLDDREDSRNPHECCGDSFEESNCKKMKMVCQPIDDCTLFGCFTYGAFRTFEQLTHALLLYDN